MTHTHTKTGVICYNTKTNRPIGLDQLSGGYPFDVAEDRLQETHFFKIFEEADKYAKMFKDLVPHTATLTLTLEIK